MAYDPELAERFRTALRDLQGISEKRMMGGICFFLNGNMVGGADRPKAGPCRLMFRVGKDNADKAAELGAAAPLQLGERIMPGFYFVDADNCDDANFSAWMALALSNARALPPK